MSTPQPFPTKQLTRLTGHTGPVHAVTFSAGSGQYILTGSQDRSIRLFNPSSGTLVQKFSAHGHEVLDIAVSADNARLVSVGGDKQVFLWDVATARTLRRFGGHAARVNGCAFGGGGEAVLVTGSYDGSVKVWDVRQKGDRPLVTLGEAKDSVATVCVRGAEIWAGSVDGRVRVYDLAAGVVLVDVIGHPVTSVTPTKLGDGYLVSTLDGTLRLMDRPTGKLLQSFTAPGYKNDTYRIRSTLARADGTVISGSEDGQIFVWDVLSGNVLHELRHSRDGQKTGTKKDVVSAVAWNQSRRMWASAGGDGEVAVWGVEE